jgi:hypothetical protein
MTVLWYALIAVGLLMITVAVWPSIRERGRTPLPGDPGATGEVAPDRMDNSDQI